MKTSDSFIINKIKTFKNENNLQWPNSLELLVYQKGQKKIHIKEGKDYKFYDLASLTKILFTTTAFMKAVEENKIKLSDTVQKVMPSWSHKNMKINHLLAHQSYLKWWQPYYKRLSLIKAPLEKKNYLKKRLFKEKLYENPVYSDLDFWTLGIILEEIYEKSLFEIWQKIYQRNYFKDMHFNPMNKSTYKKTLYAPTEKCPWRKKILKAEVHDDNAWSMGGVAAHAGLFGGAQDVAKWGLSLRQVLNENSSYEKWISSRTLKRFLKRQKLDQNQNKKQNQNATLSYDWTLGFMLPTPGHSSCGTYFHPQSVGHTGFTGTSFWWDIKKDIQVTLLSNRVHPTRENKDFVKLRPIIHNWVIEQLLKL